MKFNAKSRNRRIRKKLHVDEYQELGFDIAWKFEEGTSNQEIHDFIDKFFAQAIGANGLGFAGEGDLLWHGLICTQKSGKCTQEHINLVVDWLTKHGAKSVTPSALYDFWWG